MKLLIIGSRGEFGSHLKAELKKDKVNHTIITVDRVKNEDELNSFTFEDVIPFSDLDLIINCTGSFKADSYRSKNLLSNYQEVFDANLKTSLWATGMAAKLKKGSLFILVGACAAVLEDRPKMLTYSLAKHSLSKLTKLLSSDKDLLETSFILLLPGTLKTKSNMEYFKNDSDKDQMIPLEDMCNAVIGLLNSDSSTRPASGSMIEIGRKDGKTLEKIHFLNSDKAASE